MKDSNQKSKKNLIIIVSLIVIIIVCILIFLFYKASTNETDIKNVTNDIDMTNTENVKLENDKKINISDKMKEEVLYEELSINMEELSSDANETKIKLKVKNLSDEMYIGKEINIVFYTESGNEYGSINSYISDLEPNEEKEVEVTTTLDVANAYSFSVK